MTDQAHDPSDEDKAKAREWLLAEGCMPEDIRHLRLALAHFRAAARAEGYAAGVAAERREWQPSAERLGEIARLNNVPEQCWRWGQPDEPANERCVLPKDHLGPCVTKKRDR